MIKLLGTKSLNGRSIVARKKDLEAGSNDGHKMGKRRTTIAGLLIELIDSMADEGQKAN